MDNKKENLDKDKNEHKKNYTKYIIMLFIIVTLILLAVIFMLCRKNSPNNSNTVNENTFFQLEGMVIDKNVSISNLLYVMKGILSEIFGKVVEVRLRPGYFPFVEPGFELDVKCLICNGKGCPTCKDSGWLELCPCGMVHPKVLKMSNIDPNIYSGFAFGIGLTRLAMMKYHINDIRILNSCDLEELSQFDIM